MAPLTLWRRRPRRLRIAPAALALATCLAILPWWPLRLCSADTTAAMTLPPSFTPYTSRVLPYSIGYPAGWHADGSIFGTAPRPAGIYYDADSFSRRLIGFEVQRGVGKEELRTTEAVFVAAHRGWRIGLTVVITGTARAALLPSFAAMLGTFHQR